MKLPQLKDRRATVALYFVVAAVLSQSVYVQLITPDGFNLIIDVDKGQTIQSDN